MKLEQYLRIKYAGPFGHPDLKPSNEPVNPELKQRLTDQKHFVNYMDKLLSGKVIKTDPENALDTPENAKAKKLFKSMMKRKPND